MKLEDIYLPINDELTGVDELLRKSLKNSGYRFISGISDYLLDTKGKRLRPALVILSAKASHDSSREKNKEALIALAAAVELVHMASLIHDDVIDHADIRHNKPSINQRYGQDVSISVGDYLYSRAFELIANCENIDIVSCISQATRLMCEGQLIQVCERDNLNLLKNRYIIFVKKKTAALFSASCQSGAILAQAKVSYKNILADFGLNFGIAFQMADDCLDLIGREKDLGKAPGSDLKMGELTLPILNLISQSRDKERIMSLIRQRDNPEAFNDLRSRFINSSAAVKTKTDIQFYVGRAKQKLNELEKSDFRSSLSSLADFILQRVKI